MKKETSADIDLTPPLPVEEFEIYLRMQIALRLLVTERGSHPQTGELLSGEFEVAASPQAWRWRLRFVQGTNHYLERPQGTISEEWRHGEGPDDPQKEYPWTASVAISMHRALDATTLMDRLLRAQEQWKEDMVGVEQKLTSRAWMQAQMQRMVEQVEQARPVAHHYFWCGSLLPSQRGLRLLMRFSRQPGWQLIGYRVEGTAQEPRVRRDTLARGDFPLAVPGASGRSISISARVPPARLARRVAQIFEQVMLLADLAPPPPTLPVVVRAQPWQWTALRRELSERAQEAAKVLAHPRMSWYVPWHPRQHRTTPPEPYFAPEQIADERVWSAPKPPSSARRGGIVQAFVLNRRVYVRAYVLLWEEQALKSREVLEFGFENRIQLVYSSELEGERATPNTADIFFEEIAMARTPPQKTAEKLIGKFSNHIWENACAPTYKPLKK